MTVTTVRTTVLAQAIDTLEHMTTSVAAIGFDGEYAGDVSSRFMRVLLDNDQDCDEWVFHTWPLPAVRAVMEAFVVNAPEGELAGIATRLHRCMHGWKEYEMLHAYEAIFHRPCPTFAITDKAAA